MSRFNKRPTESRVYLFSFAEQPEFTAASPDNIAGATVTATLTTSGTSTLTVGSPSVNADEDGVTVTISGGADGDEYLLTCTATTDAGVIIVAKAPMKITNTPAGQVT